MATARTVSGATGFASVRYATWTSDSALAEPVAHRTKRTTFSFKSLVSFRSAKGNGNCRRLAATAYLKASHLILYANQDKSHLVHGNKAATKQSQPGGKSSMQRPRSRRPVVSKLVILCVAGLVILCVAGSATVLTALAAEPSLNVHVRLAGDHRAAARVRIVGSDENPYAPDGAALRKTTRDEAYFYADGSFDVTLPRGPSRLHFSGGIETIPRTVALDATADTELAVHLQPWIDMASRGWYSGDSHVHLHTGGPISVTVADALVAARAEGVNYVNLCVSNNVGDDIRDAELITGKPHAESTEKHLLVFGEEMRSSIYGHMQFFGIRKLVEPQYTGFDETPNRNDFPANYVMAAIACRQGGVVTYGHPMFADRPSPFGEDLTAGNAAARELPIDAIMNVVQAVDLMCYNSDEDLSAELWYRLLNCGLKLSACVGTDALLDRSTEPMGGGRVYVKIKGPLTMASWLGGLAEGRTFVTNGPIPHLEVGGSQPGSTVSTAPGNIHVTARVESYVPFDRVEVIVNGKVAVERVVASETDSATVHVHQFEVDVPLERSSWVALRVRGPEHPHVIDGPVWAHTSPVYFNVNGQPIRSAEDAQYFVDWIGQLLRVVAARDRYASVKDRQQVEALFRQAQDQFLLRAKQ